MTRFGSFGVLGNGFAGLRNLFVGSAASAALAWPVKMAGNIEQSAAQFAVFVGGAENARKILADLQEFSTVSVIPFEELSTGAALLVRYGTSAQKAVANTKALAVLAAGDTEEFQKLSLAFAQVGSAGRLQGEEMRQFKNTAFNPLREIAERTGETMYEVKQRMEDGRVSFDEVASALRAAVGPAGRFNGLLQAISNTMLGQMRKAWAQFKLAVLPLGQQVLEPITRFFKAINGIMPAFAAFIQRNAGVAKTILATLLAVVSAAIVFTTLGLAVQLTSIAMGGFLTMISMAGAAFGVLMSPLSLVVILLAELAAYFLVGTEAGRQAVTALTMYFGQLLKTATDTFEGMVNALTAGDLTLAARVLWAGLKLAWMQGTEELRATWIGFKNVFMQTTLNIVFWAMNAWTNFAAYVENLFVRMSASVRNTIIKLVGEIAKLLVSTDDEKSLIDIMTNASVNSNTIAANARRDEIDRDLKKALQEQENASVIAATAVDAATQAALQKAQEDLEATQAALDDLRKTAANEAANLGPEKDFFGTTDFKNTIGDFKTTIGGGLAKAKKATALPSLFDATLSRQVYGTTPHAELDELKKIERNTRRKGRTGLPVV